MIAKRKYNPGDLRKAGEKEYAIILSKLIGYTKKLERENNPVHMKKLCKKIIEKVREIGYKRKSNKIKTLVKNALSLEKCKSSVVELAMSAWDMGTKNHKKAKEKHKAHSA